jgi:transcriptional regulator with XRE-family HTH domain
MHPLRAWRKEQGLSQGELGKLLGKSLSEIHRIETSKVGSISLADAVAIRAITEGYVKDEELLRHHPR